MGITESVVGGTTVPTLRRLPAVQRILHNFRASVYNVRFQIFSVVKFIEDNSAAVVSTARSVDEHCALARRSQRERLSQVSLRYISDDDHDHQESQEKGGSRQAPFMYPDPPPPQLPQPIVLNPTFYASRSKILPPFPPGMTTKTSSSESVCTGKAGFESPQGDITTILALVKGIVSTLPTVTSRPSKPAVIQVMFRLSARTQEDLDARQAELANPEVYDVVVSAAVYLVILVDEVTIHNWQDVRCGYHALISQQRYADVSGEQLLVHMRRWLHNARNRTGGRLRRTTKPPKPN
ncbi:hypothetical protein EG68_03774 [Paragonimus skrjabini miyazakii]|uniref:Uncharacterized protein n=1 Tax=Paragonimus skrjabini miyazakii TaxID=59628 RepID=A0A8S9YUQ0_9TREM|nr:hypothetical protein EG68_03774 [Paragonimus skrjabini miyazakii]